ncbi:MAG: EF-hand domain-containing protein [Phycisphaerae bacterium]
MMNKVLGMSGLSATLIAVAGMHTADSTEPGIGGPHGHVPPTPPIIEALDTDEDGVLSADEVTEAGEKLMTLDVDGDGVVSVFEMLPPPPHHRVRPNAQRNQTHAERFLDRHDADEDGAVTLDEFTAPAREHYLRHDLNDDGVVTFDEFTAHLQDHFNDADANGDQEVDLEEAATLPPPHRPHHRMHHGPRGPHAGRGKRH